MNVNGSRHVITGGAGFIGVNLADRLLREGEHVVVLDDFSRKGGRLNAEWLRARHPHVLIVEADVRRDLALLGRLLGDAGAVYHLAGQVAVTTSVADPRMDFERNALGTLNVLETIRLSGNAPTLVYASTNKVYGQLGDLPIEEGARRYRYADDARGIAEDQPLDFHSPYGCSKGAADQYVQDYARTYDLPTVVLRQSCIYGARQFGIEDQGWLAWFAICAILGRPVTIYGSGKQVRDVLHISDLIDLIRVVVQRIDVTKGQIYNVGGGPNNSLSLLESLEVLERCLGVSMQRSFAEARPGDQRVYVSDISRAFSDLGWSPRVDPETGIELLAAWSTSNRALFDAMYPVALPERVV